MHKLLLLISIVLLTTVNIVNAGLFKWVDANGKVHYSDSAPAHAKSSTTLEIDSFSNNSEELASVEEPADGVETVDLYTTSWCPYCAKARAFLQANNVLFNDYDIEKDTNAAQRKRELAPGYSGIPLAVIKGKVIRGFSEDTYQTALNE